MNNYGFKSVFSTYMESFLYEREARGFLKEKHLAVLRDFDKMLVQNNHMELALSQRDYDLWLETQANVGYSTRYDKVTKIRQFFDFLIRNGIPCPMPRRLKYKKCEYVPYIFTEEEIVKVFEEADRLESRIASRNSAVMAIPAIIRTLYSTGARIGEILSILNRDVDFKRHIITLHHTKNGRERFLPINSSLESVLKQYISFRDKMPIDRIDAPEKHLFVCLNGSYVRPGNFVKWYKLVLERSGIIDTYNLKIPRIHDIRHTACMHVMHKMSKDGTDLYCHLPAISAFMGHVKMTDTENYLRLAKQYYPELLEQQEEILSAIKGIVNRAITHKSDDDV